MHVCKSPIPSTVLSNYDPQGFMEDVRNIDWHTQLFCAAKYRPYNIHFIISQVHGMKALVIWSGLLW